MRNPLRKKTLTSSMAKAIFETGDNQLIPLDDIQHINARRKENQAKGYETFTVLYKSGMKVEIPLIEYDNIFNAWEERKNGRLR